MIVGLVIAIVSLALTAFLIYPFFERRGMEGTPIPTLPSNRRRQLREEKAAHLLALRELDFDFEVGKLSAIDYKELRTKYEAKAIEVMKELEATEAAWKELQDEIDAELKKRVGIQPESKPVQNVRSIATAQVRHSCGGSNKLSDRFCSRCGEPTGGHCASCGKPLSLGDRYCPTCGTEVEKRAKA